MKNKKHLIYFFTFFCIYLFSFCTHGIFGQTLLKGGVRTVIEKGNTFVVSLSTPLNFYFSQKGDKVGAYLKEDIFFGNEIYIPKGSLLEGEVVNIKEPGRFGRSGAFEIEFNQIVTPDENVIPIFASISTDTKKTEEKVADILTYDSALIAFGSFHGVLGSLQYGGLPLAIVSHGISLIAGAGIGAGAGIIGSISRKGKIPTVITGHNTSITLKSDFYILGDLERDMPWHVSTQQTVDSKENEYKGFRFNSKLRKEDISIQIDRISRKHNKKFGRYIVLNLTAKNNSNQDISLNNLVLINEITQEELNPDLFLSGTEALKIVKPNQETKTTLAFQVKKDIKKHSLVLIDPLDRTRILQIPVLIGK